MNWVIFTLISRALWAADNVVDKLLIGKHLKDPVVLTLIAGIYALLLSLVIIIFNGLSWIGLEPVQNRLLIRGNRRTIPTRSLI